MNKKEALSYIKNISIILIAFVFLVFPTFFLNQTTDFFTLPKQLLITYASIILLALFLLRTVIEGKITIRSNPFNLPLFVISAVAVTSSILSQNRYDSLIQVIPFLFLSVLYFTIVNNIEDKLSFNLAIYSLIFGAVINSLVVILSFFKIYIFPFPETHSQYFSSFGSSLQQAIYLVAIFLISSYYLFKFAKNKILDYESIIIYLSTLIIGASVILLLYQVFFSPQKTIILPFMYGFQIALAVISQDSQRFFASFLFGSGFGTFLSDFTRFKLLSFNQTNLWNVNFASSSTFFLELLSTTGLLGAISFFFLLIKVFRTRLAKTNIIYITIVLLLLISFILPFSYSTLFLLFALLAIYASYLYVQKTKYVDNVIFSLVALREGLINVEPQNGHNASKKSESRVLPGVFFIAVVALTGFIGYQSAMLLSSDVKFRNSLLQVSANNGQNAYNLQRESIQTFPYKSDYYRVFSQLNLALANSLSGAITQKPEQQNTQVQQTVIALLQQSITSGRAAVTMSPLTSANWQNLSQIYRNLIGVGQNADQFAIATLQQTIALDQYNPQLYVELGGIYYQLKQYELAQNQFQIAVNLKKDYANAYYNLGHTLEAKGDLANALIMYNAVKELTKNDPVNANKILAEIDALQNKVKETDADTNDQITAAPKISPNTYTGQQQPLQVSTPSAKIPAQKQPVKIAPPPLTATPTPSVNPSPSTTPSESPSPTTQP